ncbi:MAG: UDP-2,3-diacylglucosamine diphosphatase [Gammaproteobacteria bacterium]|nr:UDP-2,3-diacylglucosamine diphosphatase [Gammaproteobacteria bacterium]
MSDLHISETQPQVMEVFLRFSEKIKKMAGQIDALYILGDFFEAWPGDDYQSKLTETAIHALKTMTNAGVVVYFMRGNHDFLIGNDFLRKTGCKLILDPYVANIYGNRVLLMHGDTLLTNHLKYRLYRAFVQNSLIRWLILKILPLKKRKALADELNAASNYRKPITTIPFSRVAQLMKKYHVNYFIHGHLHKPAMDHISTHPKQNPMTRIVLGAWGQSDQNILICQPKSNHKNQLNFSFLNAANDKKNDKW